MEERVYGTALNDVEAECAVASGAARSAVVRNGWFKMPTSKFLRQCGIAWGGISMATGDNLQAIAEYMETRAETVNAGKAAAFNEAAGDINLLKLFDWVAAVVFEHKTDTVSIPISDWAEMCGLSTKTARQKCEKFCEICGKEFRVGNAFFRLAADTYEREDGTRTGGKITTGGGGKGAILSITLTPEIKAEILRYKGAAWMPLKMYSIPDRRRAEYLLARKFYDDVHAMEYYSERGQRHRSNEYTLEELLCTIRTRTNSREDNHNGKDARVRRELDRAMAYLCKQGYINAARTERGYTVLLQKNGAVCHLSPSAMLRRGSEDPRVRDAFDAGYDAKCTRLMVLRDKELLAEEKRRAAAGSAEARKAVAELTACLKADRKVRRETREEYAKRYNAFLEGCTPAQRGGAAKIDVPDP